jgi:hypothetical protein
MLEVICAFFPSLLIIVFAFRALSILTTVLRTVGNEPAAIPTPNRAQFALLPETWLLLSTLSLLSALTSCVRVRSLDICAVTVLRRPAWLISAYPATKKACNGPKRAATKSGTAAIDSQQLSHEISQRSLDQLSTHPRGGRGNLAFSVPSTCAAHLPHTPLHPRTSNCTKIVVESS